MNFHEFVKMTRKERGKTLIQVAKESGLSYSMLYRIEDGLIEKPHPDQLKALSKPLNISYDAMLNLAGYIKPKQATVSHKHAHIKKVPIISWQSVLKVLESTKEIPSELSEETIDIAHADGDMFAIKLTTNSYGPFKKNHILVCQKKSALKTGDYAFTIQAASIVLGEVLMMNNQKLLKSIHQEDTKDVCLLTDKSQAAKVIQLVF